MSYAGDPNLLQRFVPVDSNGNAITGAPTSGTAVLSLNGLVNNVIISGVGTVNVTTLGNTITVSGTGDGTGDVHGPSSSTDTAIVRFSGTSGKSVENSTWLLDGSGNLTANPLSIGPGGAFAGKMTMINNQITITADDYVALGTNSGASFINSGADTYLIGVNNIIVQSPKLNASNGSLAHGTSVSTLGTNSYAGGSSNLASGNNSHAEGEATIAQGIRSHAEGESTIAKGFAAHAEGSNSIALANYSHAEGGSTNSNGQYSHAEGLTTTAAGIASHSEGDSTNAGGDSSHAEGRSSQAAGLAAHAQGGFSSAGGDYSFAAGYLALAPNNNSIAFSDVNGITTTAINQFKISFANGLVLNSGTNILTTGSGVNTIGTDTNPFSGAYVKTGYFTNLSGLSPINLQSNVQPISSGNISLGTTNLPFDTIYANAFFISGIHINPFPITTPTTTTNTAVTKWSGTAGAGLLDTSILINSTNDLIPATSGTLNVGTAASPFSGVTANNYNTTRISGAVTNSSTTINFNNGASQILTWSNGQPSGTTLTINGLTAGSSYVLETAQNASGTGFITWPTTIKWNQGASGTMTPSGVAVDLFTFYCTNGTNLFGNYSNNYF